MYCKTWKMYLYVLKEKLWYQTLNVHTFFNFFKKCTSFCTIQLAICDICNSVFQDQFFDSKQVKILQKKLMQLLAEVRPNAVAFVDAFDYPDEVLQSCLGRYDGQVYQALYDYAKSSPMNEKEVYDIPVHEVHHNWAING